jgi:hypothetical protein
MDLEIHTCENNNWNALLPTILNVVATNLVFLE